VKKLPSPSPYLKKTAPPPPPPTGLVTGADVGKRVRVGKQLGVLVEYRALSTRHPCVVDLDIGRRWYARRADVYLCEEESRHGEAE
jgi:hypothetical protein